MYVLGTGLTRILGRLQSPFLEEGEKLSTKRRWGMCEGLQILSHTLAVDAFLS